MVIETRTLEPEWLQTWYDRVERAFGGAPEPAEERAMWCGLLEPDRALAVRDEGDIVGTSGAFDLRVSVPGGALVPAAGITMVSVQPTHRRRGILTAMVRRLLDDAHGRGEPLAVLTASEPTIYGRFGFGGATRQMRLTADTSRIRLLVPEGPGGVDGVRLRVGPPAESLAACEAVYARRVAARPGMTARRPGWEALSTIDAPGARDGAGELLCVTAERDGRVSGYARYATKSHWSAAGPEGTVVLRDLEADDPVSYAALARFLFGIDLTCTLTSLNRPADDPLLHLVDDVRRCQVGLREGLFARLLDVGAALSARVYSAPVDVVLEVADAFCPWNAGRWRLSGDPKGAVCEPTTDPADLALSARELGAAYLGGFSLAALAAAGRVREAREGALERAAAAFRTPVEPWLPHGF